MKLLNLVRACSVLVPVGALLFACGGSDDTGASGTSSPSGGAAGSSAGAGGKAGTSAGGTSAGTGGTSAGTGGTAAGAGGSSAGAAGSPAGAGGSTAGAGGSAAGAGGSAGAGGTPACSTFDQPQTTSPTGVRLLNNTTETLFLGPVSPDCKFHLGFDAEDAAGKPLKLTTDPCEFTCGDQQSNGCSCPPVACNPPIVTQLAPGAGYEIGWTGTWFPNGNMPAGCYKEASCATHGCFVETLAPIPSTLKASAWSEAKGCSPSACASCTPGASGNCTVSGASSVGGTEHKGTVTWTGQSKVVIAFN